MFRSDHPYSASASAQEKAEYGRAIDLLYDLRHSGGTYTQLLRRHRLSTRKAHRYLGANLLSGKRGTRVQASKTDMLVRELMFPTPEGDMPVLVRGLPAATKLSNFFLDRAKLLGGDIGIREFEAKWRGRRIGGREVFADGDAILRMADADIFDLEHLYSKVGPARSGALPKVFFATLGNGYVRRGESVPFASRPITSADVTTSLTSPSRCVRLITQL